MNDEAQRRGADVREGITSDQRQFLTGGAVEHPGILGPNDFSGRDSIVVRAFRRGDLNHVAYGDVVEAAKHGIPMGSNAHIAGLSRE